MVTELIIAALAGGGIASVVTSWAMRRKIDAEAEEIEERIRKGVIESLQGHIDFQNSQIEKLRDSIQAQEIRIAAQEEEIELLRKRNGELEARLERYEKQADTGLHEVLG